jgi:hypothetical protein
MRFVALALITLCALHISSIARAAQSMVQVVRIPDGGIHPQSQVDSRGRVHLIYFKGDPKHGDIFYVRSDDGGATFTNPIRVNSQPDSAMIIGTIRGPHIAIGKDDRPHVAWMGSDKAEPKALAKATPMLYARLNDVGDAFEAQRNIIQQHPGLDGGGSVAADHAGNVYVAWHAPDKGDAEEDRQVWLARSRDDGKTFEPEHAVVPKKTGACGCCGLNIAASDDGRVAIVFRSATAMVNRDIHVLASKDFGQTFEIVAKDPWMIGKCVMSTAALAPRGHDLLAAWETKEQVQFAVLNDSPATVKRMSVPGAAKNRKYPSIAANANGDYIIAWAEGAGWNKGGTVAWQAFDAHGQPLQGQAGRFSGLVPWSLPAVFATSNGTFRVFY